jgi:hypothetical protein
MLNRPMLSVVIMPTVYVRPECRLRAAALATKPSRSAASRTRSRVSGRRLPRPLSALDAVPAETPASAATSVMVTARPMVASVSSRVSAPFADGHRNPTVISP